MGERWRKGIRKREKWDGEKEGEKKERDDEWGGEKRESRRRGGGKSEEGERSKIKKKDNERKRELEGGREKKIEREPIPRNKPNAQWYKNRSILYTFDVNLYRFVSPLDFIFFLFHRIPFSSNIASFLPAISAVYLFSGVENLLSSCYKSININK